MIYYVYIIVNHDCMYVMDIVNILCYNVVIIVLLALLFFLFVCFVLFFVWMVIILTKEQIIIIQ